MSAFVIKPAALPAWHALCGALDQLDAEGRATFCRTDPAPFTSDDQEERAEAAAACGACPVVAACRRFGIDNKEPAHVWGGIDRTPRPYRKAVA
ncbi:MAG: WhiB family transcriptional regulator [Nocardioides sp.]|nr:WhiB family transcriptional regulator [Nocardioides sp.]